MTPTGYVDEHHIADEELPEAFAAWLREQTGGQWDGAMRPVEDVELPSGQYGPTADYGGDGEP